jgi:hypothetical protein
MLVSLDRDRFQAGVGVERPEDVPDVVAHCLGAEVALGGDLLSRSATLQSGSTSVCRGVRLGWAARDGSLSSMRLAWLKTSGLVCDEAASDRPDEAGRGADEAREAAGQLPSPGPPISYL